MSAANRCVDYPTIISIQNSAGQLAAHPVHSLVTVGNCSTSPLGRAPDRPWRSLDWPRCVAVVIRNASMILKAQDEFIAWSLWCKLGYFYIQLHTIDNFYSLVFKLGNLAVTPALSWRNSVDLMGVRLTIHNWMPSLLCVAIHQDLYACA